MTDKKQWENRIVGLATKPADQFMANPRNARIHPQAQRAAVKGSLNELGWVGTPTENVRTGNLIDGHERIWQALKNDNAEVPYLMVDISEEEEALYLTTFDYITSMANYDREMLDSLLRDVQTGDADLQALLSEIAEDAGLNYADVEFREYDESIADEVEMCTCPQCGHEFPK